MLIGCKHFILSVWVHCAMQNKLSGQINLFLLNSYHVLSSRYVCFFRRFWRIIYFCVIMDSVQTSFLAPYILKTLLEWKLKWKEMTEWFPNCRFFRKIFLNYPSNVEKIKLEHFLLTTDVKKTYFEVAPPCDTMLTNTLTI